MFSTIADITLGSRHVFARKIPKQILGLNSCILPPQTPSCRLRFLRYL
jgi:hypothetical protein